MKTNMNSKNYFSILLASALALCGNVVLAKGVSDPVKGELAKIFDCDNTATVVEVMTNESGETIGHRVILGQDYGPLAFSNNFGAVTIDLNGWTIKGTNGVNGTTTTAGGNGCAAIMVDGSFGAGAGPTTIMVQDDSGVQLWENGPYFAKCNVGATKPEESGYYFWWGDTVGYTNSGSAWVPVKDGATITFDNNPPANSTYNKTLETLRSQGWIDENGNLVATNDAATVHLGAPWRMPTKAELDALVENCTTVWTNNWNGTGINGRLVTGKDAYASKSIFLPTAGRVCDSALDLTDTNGYYWPSTPNSITNVAWDLDFASDRFNVDNNFRYLGFPVRAVRGRPAAVIAGGNGGNGNPAGKGSPAVADATGAAVAVTDPDGFVANGVDGALLKSKTQEELEGIFDTANTPTVIELMHGADGAFAGYKVILGKDYGPLALSNDFGAVTIDLNGWSIKGTDGANGSGSTAGGNGGAAIMIDGTCGANLGATAITAIDGFHVDAEGFDTTGKAVDYSTTFIPGDYCVVDLATGAVTEYKDVIDGTIFNTDEYKTTKMAFRYVPAGKFKAKACKTFGVSEPYVYNDVTLSAYWIAVFPLTVAQYNMIMGGETTDTVLKGSVSWNTVRGNLGGDPKVDSFVDKLNKLSNLGLCHLDLCTSLQWERAVRAGTRTDYFFTEVSALSTDSDDPSHGGAGNLEIAGDLEKSLSTYAWYNYNVLSTDAKPKPVGEKAANAWGLYDAYGNGSIACYDRHTTNPPNGQSLVDYKGPTSGSTVVIRGGNVCEAKYCSSIARSNIYATSTDLVDTGFRLVLTGMSPVVNRPVSGTGAAIVGGKGGNGIPVGQGSEAIVDGSGVKVAATDPAGLVKKGEDGKVPGSKECPWKVGEAGSEDTVQAYTNGNGTVIIEGTGAMKDFGECGPWGVDITGVAISNGVMSIGKKAFANCSNIESVTFAPDSQLNSIGTNAFASCTSLSSITVPAKVTHIGQFAFASCSSLTNVTFAPDSQLAKIDSAVFSKCPLMGITIPESVTSIGTLSFSECTNLTEVTIPAGVTHIGTFAFMGCSSLATVTMLETTPPAIDKSFAADFTALTPLASLTAIKVPVGTVENYKTAPGWSMYAYLITDGLIEYFDWDAEAKALVAKTCTVYVIVTPEMATFTNGGWYVVNGDITNTTDGIVVDGAAHLILCDDTKLVVLDASKAGVEVSASDSVTNSLAIYGQANGTGILETSSSGGAGIGGDSCDAGGSVTVNGGTVIATGGNQGAGIGGGDWSEGGIVTVNGGTLIATGSFTAAGIGGGQSGAGGTVTINGGTVTANGGEYAAGIGAGLAGSNGGIVEINGGTVTANGGGTAAGIGGGQLGKGGMVTINGGTVTANGGEYAAGIGGGYDDSAESRCDDGTLTFGPDFKGGVLAGADEASAVFMTQEAYTNDHGARFATMPAIALAIPPIKGLVYAVMNGEDEISALVSDGIAYYVTTNHATLTVGFELLPGFVYTKAPDPNPMTVPDVTNITYLTEADLPAVKSAVQIVLEKIFDTANTPTTVEPVYDESGALSGHKVILGTNYGPLAFSNDFGAVALDLNGWTIKGADGTAGTGTTAGGSGGAAITICAGETPPPQSVTAISVRDPQLTGTPLVLDSAKGDAMVIDLEADTTGHFPVTYHSDIDFGLFNCDAYKTTKIVLRKVPAGTYACEPGAKAAISKTQVVTKPYYIGVFQVTKAQYDRVMTAGSTETSMKPEDTLSYNAIRKNNNSGYMLPTDPVASDSFMGVLAAKSGLDGFDLPTEVQWEIAARATSTEAYGSYIDASNQRVDMSNFDGNAGWYESNSGYVTHDVGGKRPNLWGIHDTAGNVWEWCLDMYCSPFPSEATAETPYSGGSSGGRVRRGGSNDNDAWDCRPSYRALSFAPDTGNLGFRLSRICTDDVPSASRPDYGSSAAIVGGKGGDGNPVGNGGEAIVGVAVPVAGSTELVKKGEDGALLKSKAQEELENIFDIENTGTTVEPVYDESGVLAGHKVTLGADYGPLALFNDFGAVAINLNGWVIRGADGLDSATGLTAGGNGGPAIVISGACGSTLGATAIAVTNDVTIGGVQLWENGPYFAECNVGATKPEEYGYYFWWGDTVGYTNNGNAWLSVADGTTSITFDKNPPANSTFSQSYERLKDLGYINDAANPVLNAAHDAATAHFGAPWRMMTDEELLKFYDQTTSAVCEWIWDRARKGYTVKGKGAYSTKSVFLPASGEGSSSGIINSDTGYYWSSTPSPDRDYYAWSLYFASREIQHYDISRYYGQLVRPVRDDVVLRAGIFGGNGGDGAPGGRGSEAIVNGSGAKVAVVDPLGRVKKGEDGISLGSSANPWKIGPNGSDLPQAYTNGNGGLVIEGEGTVEKKPWLDDKDGITAITIKDPEVELPGDAFAGMGSDDEKIKIVLPDNWKGELPDGDGNWYGAKAEIANVPFLVRNVKFLQRYPWNGLVDITADLMGYDGADVEIMASVEEKILKISAKSITGQTKDILFDENHTAKAKLVWDANYDFKSGFRSEAVTVILRATSAADRHYNTIMSDLDSFERNLADAEKRAKGLPGNDFKECVNRMLASCPRFSSAIVTARADAQSAYNASNLVETARIIEASVASNMAKFAKEYEEFRASVDKIEAEEMAAQAMFMASVQKFQMDIKALETMMKDCKEHSSYAQAVDTAERTLVTIKEDLNTLSRDVEKSVSEHDILLRQNDFNDGFKDIDNRIKAVKEQLYMDIDDADRADQAAQEELVGALDAFDKSVGEFAKEVNDYSPTTSGQTKAVEEAVKKIKEFGAYSAALKEAIVRCASDHDMSANKQNFVDNINALKNELAVEKKKFEDAIANNSAGGVE